MDPQAPPPSAPSPSPSPTTCRTHDYDHRPSRRDPDYAHHGDYAYHQHSPQRTHRSSRISDDTGHVTSPKPSSPPSPASSLLSAARKHRSIPDIESAAPVNVSRPPDAHLDPEKADHPQYQPDPNVTHVIYDPGEYHEKGPEEKPIQLLLFLSGPCFALSLLLTLWTFFSLLITLVLQPFRLCRAGRPSFGSQLTTFLAPPLNLQLRLIYSFSSATEYSVPMLVVVLLFSPIVAVGVAIGAWTAACFWFFSAILGDPAGQDQGHNDGKDSLLGVRNWWDRWLSRGLRTTSLLSV